MLQSGVGTENRIAREFPSYGSSERQPREIPAMSQPIREIFRPKRPADLNTAGLSSTQVEGLILKTCWGPAVVPAGRSPPRLDCRSPFCSMSFNGFRSRSF